jgi:hypothetical protein
MARISYDEPTAAAFKAVREVPRDGLAEWREAVRRHLRPSQGMTLVDIGAGTGAFAAAFSDWFDLSVLAVEPSAAMRDQIPPTAAIQVLEGTASSLPLPDESADAAKAFAAAGFHQDALEQVRETYPTSLADFLGQVDTFRQADTTMRNLTEDEFLRGKERLRRAVRRAEDTANPEARSNWLDLLVLR